MMDATVDSRFPTRNTNLAACLAALRIPIKHSDPVYVVEQGEASPVEAAVPAAQATRLPPQQKRTVTYFFEEQSAPNNDGYAIEQATHVDWAWRNRDKFEAENADHPLVHMRKAIDKLEWLIKVKHGQIKPAYRYPNDAPDFATDDILLAACFMGADHPLHSFSGAKFRFLSSGKEQERIIEEFACFRHGKDPVCYMRKALEARKELIALVKRAPVLLRYQNGDKEGFIPKDCSAEKLNQFFELLYE